MARYSKNSKAHSDAISEQTQAEALALARGIQKPKQTKEQTKLIAQGIQKGISLYKKQQKSKARELDKRLKKASAPRSPIDSTEPVDSDAISPPTKTKLAWLLLAASWLLFAGHFVISH